MAKVEIYTSDGRKTTVYTDDTQPYDALPFITSTVVATVITEDE
jgi:hypothetical protein